MDTLRQESNYALCWSVISNAVLVVVKATAGYFGHSYALITDAIESANDTVSSVLMLLGLRYSTKPPDDNHPYGHGKAEAIVTFLVVVFLVASATIIAYHSIHRMQTDHPAPRAWTLLVLGIVVMIKEGMYRYMLSKGKAVDSTLLKADAWHHRSDAFTSIAAFIGISIALLGGPGFEKADDWAALIASGFILYNAYLIFRPALSEIMDEQIYDELNTRVREVAVKVEGILGTEKCHIRKIGMSYWIDLHAIVDQNLSVLEGHRIAHQLKDQIRRDIPQIKDVLVHVEPN